MTIFKNNMKEKTDMKKIMKIGALIANLLLIVSLFLPLYHVNVTGENAEMIEELSGDDIEMIRGLSLMNVDGEMGDGIIFIVPAVLCIVFLCLNKGIPSVIVSALSAAFCVYKMNVLLSAIQSMSTQDTDMGFSMNAGAGVGLILLAIACAAALICCILFFVAVKKEKKEQKANQIA